MYLKKLLNSDKLYASANLFFAAANAVSSLLIVKFFGLRLYGFMTYFNSIDTFIDYLGGHVRSTFEYTSASSNNLEKAIKSFAVLQLFLGLISVFVFLFLSFFQSDTIAIKICQIFIFLSPGKSYLSFFRILSKVSGSLKGYSIIVILLSVLNIIFLLISNLYYDFYIFLIFRAFLLLSFSSILFLLYNLDTNNILNRLSYTFKELKYKSKNLLFYSFISLSAIVLDKILIKNFFGAEALGVYSLSFLAYNMILIFGGSLIGGNFKVLTKCISKNYNKILQDSILWTILFVISLELLAAIFTVYPYFSIYRGSVSYMVWFLPASILGLFVQISYIFLISKKYLSLFNNGFFYLTFLYLLSSTILSVHYENTIWFAIIFLVYQIIVVVYLAIRFDFLSNIFKECIYHSKKIILAFIIFQIIFTSII